jgi:ATP-dependent Clp protease ATP-binding subunit ClpA
VRKVISQITSIPLDQITAAERVRHEDLDKRLRKKIIGQDEAVSRVVASVK